MSDVFLSQIYIYPIKSLRGVVLEQSSLDKFGLEWDRRWMLVDEKGVFISQREETKLSLLAVEVFDDFFRVKHIHLETPFVDIPKRSTNGKKVMVTVWEDEVEAELVSGEVDDYFSNYLGRTCRLVFFPNESKRFVDDNFATQKEQTSFSDGFPLLMISEESLAFLNEKLEEKISMERFRPNLVIKGIEPHGEDDLSTFSINTIKMRGVKPCSRCVVITIDPNTGKKGKEPLKTLSSYRLRDKKIMFGQNVLFSGEGELRVGDRLLFGE